MRRTDIKLFALVAVLAGLSLLLSACSPADDPADTQAPSVTFISPTDGAMVPNTLDITVQATDNVEVTKVEFYVDGSLYSTDETAPWACYWTAEVDQAGEHTIYARAYDAAGNASNSSTITINCAISPPAQVTDLAASGLDLAGNLTLTWTAPGGDGTTGTAAEYDIRYYWTTLTDENWVSAAPLDGEPTPQAAGNTESFDISDLRLSTTYYFALRAIDAEGNQSEISNSVEVQTLDLFEEDVRFAISEDYRSAHVVDVDLDGNLDLILTLWLESDNISVMYGVGDGTFEAPVLFDGREFPSTVGAGDFDHDGDVDLVAANWAGNDTVTVDFYCYPDSSFDTTWSGDVVVSIDTNVVKVCEELIANNVSLLTLLYNQGDRTFEPLGIQYGFYDTSYYWCAYPVPNNVYCLACYARDPIARYEPDAYCPTLDSLTFDSTLLEHITWANPISVAVTDLTGDDWVDLAFADQGNNIGSVSHNLADGSGTFMNPRDTMAGGSGTSAVVAGDLNNDGYTDLVITAVNVDQVSIFINDGTGHFPTRSTVGTPDQPSRACIVDYDEDGDNDIIVAGRGDNLVGIINNNNGLFPLNSTDYQAGRGPASVAVGDIDGDGAVDIAVANLYGSDVSVLLNQGDFQFYSFNTVSFPVGEAPRDIFCGDFDNDGDMDLMTVNSESYDVSILFNRTIE